MSDSERLYNSLREIHSALDDALGDSDVTHIEDDDELRSEHPTQWAAQKLAELITSLEPDWKLAWAETNKLLHEALDVIEAIDSECLLSGQLKDLADTALANRPAKEPR